MEEIKEILDTIREIVSLDQYILKHMNIIKDEQARITHIKNLQQAKKEDKLTAKTDFQKLQTSLSQNEKNLHSLEEELLKTQKNLNQVTTQAQLNAFNNEIKRFSSEKEELENTIFEQMEKIEALEAKIAEFTEYIEGSEESLKEIKLEVEKIEGLEQKEICHYEERIQLLFEELPEEVREKFSRLRERLRFKNPVAFVSASTCPQCGISVPNSKIQSMLSYKSLEFCSNCQRVLVPC